MIETYSSDKPRPSYNYRTHDKRGGGVCCVGSESQTADSVTSMSLCCSESLWEELHTSSLAPSNPKNANVCVGLKIDFSSCMINPNFSKDHKCKTHCLHIL